MIGRRGIDCDVEFNWDDSISRRHARIWLHEGQIWFEDLGSRNGSWLDGVQIEGTLRLEPGMRILVGETELAVPDHLTPFETDPDDTQSVLT